MKRKEPEAASGGWEFEVGHGSWKAFGDEDAELLESLSGAHPAGKVSTKAFSFGKGTTYDLDFGAGTQTNTATGKVRKLRHTASASEPSGAASRLHAPPAGTVARVSGHLGHVAVPASSSAPGSRSVEPKPPVREPPTAGAAPPATVETRAGEPPEKKARASEDVDSASAPPAPPLASPPEEPPDVEPEAGHAAGASSKDTRVSFSESLREAASPADASRTLKAEELEEATGKWEFEVGHGHWKSFGAEDTALLESLKPLGKASTKGFSFGKGSTYDVDFEAGKQINTVTGKVRNIRYRLDSSGKAPAGAAPAGAAATTVEKPATDSGGDSTVPTKPIIKKARSSDDIDFAGAISATPVSAPLEEPPAPKVEKLPDAEAEELAAASPSASATAVAEEPTVAAPPATTAAALGAKKKSAWSADSKIPDGPPMSVEAIKKQASLGAQSKRGRKKVSFGGAIDGNKHATHCFEKMMENEKRNCGEWAVFYHSYSHAALIYEVQAAIAAVLFRFKSAYAPLPRLMRGCFSEIPDAPSMMKEFPSWPEQDHNPRFKCVGICATTSLLGMDPEAPPTMVFLGGYAASTIPISVVEGLLTDCGIGIPLAKKLTRQIMDLAGKYGLDVLAFGGKGSISGHSGHLLQIFMKRHLVDKYAYASHPMGVPDPKRHPIGEHLKTCGLSPPGHIVGQVRIVVHPSAFLQANKVRMFVYSADEEFHKSRSDFQELITALLSPVLGSEEARVRAAKAIFGGSLPSWFRADDQRETATTAPKKLGEDDWK